MLNHILQLQVEETLDDMVDVSVAHGAVEGQRQQALSHRPGPRRVTSSIDPWS
jgi:hypothetical protein